MGQYGRKASLTIFLVLSSTLLVSLSVSGPLPLPDPTRNSSRRGSESESDPRILKLTKRDLQDDAEEEIEERMMYRPMVRNPESMKPIFV